MVGTASLYIVDAEILVLRGMSATSETKIIGFKRSTAPFERSIVILLTCILRIYPPLSRLDLNKGHS